MGEQSFVTRFRAQEEGFRQLTTELRNLGTIGDDAFKRIETSSQRSNRGLATVDATSRTLFTGFRSLTTSMLAFSGAFAGIGSVGAVFSSAANNIGDFETKFNNVRTLIDESSVSTTQLRQELLDLDPVLGSSADLAEALYQALSAGIPAADAVRFVGEAAIFAKAALVEQNTAVDVATSVLNAYGLEASATSKVFSTLFETIRLGKTTGEELSAAIGPVLPIAAELGISFEEVAAALATLTAGGLRTNTAVDALKSQFSQLIQNAQKFRDVGIDVKEVIGESGLAGLLDRLRQTTGGNAESLQLLISDVQGLIATLALTGPQLDTFSSNLQTVFSAENSHVAAAGKQTEGFRAAWEEFGNTWDRVTQQGTILSDVLEGIGRAATKALEPLTQTPLERLNTDLDALQERLARTQESLLSGLSPTGGSIVGNLYTRIFGDGPDEILADIKRVQTEIENLTLGRAGAGPADIQERISKEIEAEKVKAIETEQLAKVAAKKQQEIEDEAAKKRNAAREQENAKIYAERQKLADDYIAIAKRTNDAIEKEEAKHQKELIELGEERHQRIVDELDARLKREEDNAQKIVDAQVERFEAEEDAREKADTDAVRAAERQHDRLLEPYLELGNDISETLSDKLLEGFTRDSVFDGIKRIWADFLSRTLQAEVFQPFIDRMAQDIGSTLTAAPSGASDPQRFANIPTATTQGGALAASGARRVGSNATTSIYIVAATAAASLIAEAGGAPDVATDVITGVGTGAAVGTTIAPGLGTIIGAAIGGVISGLPHLFGGDSSSRAQVRTGATAPAQSEASDRFAAEGPFGFVSLTNESLRLDAAAAAKFVVQLDEAIASLITDRQEEAVKAMLGARDVSPTFEGATQEDAVAQIVFDRLTAVINELAGRNLSEDIFAGYEPSAENIANIAETANQLIEVLGAVDEFRSPSEPLSDAQMAINELSERFDSLAETARRFGLAEEERIIRGEEARQRAQLTDDFNTQIRRESLSFTDPQGLELELLEERRQTALQNARDLGADLSAVEARYGFERTQILERFAQQQVNIEQRRAAEIAQFNSQIGIEHLQITDPQAASFASLDNRRQEAVARAAEIGADINAVEARYGAERAALVARYAEQAAQTRAAEAAAEKAAAEQRAAARAAEIAARVQQMAQAAQFAESNLTALLTFEDTARGQLYAIKLRHRDALIDARKFGTNISEVEKRYAYERASIIQRALEEQNQIIARDFSGIEDFISGFKISENSGLTLTDRIAEASKVFNAAFAGDDVNAMIRAADELLQLEKQRSGSTEHFFKRQEEIFEQLRLFREREELEDKQAIQRQQLETQHRLVQLMQGQNQQTAQILSKMIQSSAGIDGMNAQQRQIVHLLSQMRLGRAGVS